MLRPPCKRNICFALPCYAISFSDVNSGAWYYNYVIDLADKGIINGFPDGTYKPDDGITVGQFIKLIMVASTSDRVDYELIETHSEHWAAPYVAAGENYGVFKVGEYNMSNIDKEISRIEIVKILARCDMLIKENPQKSEFKQFTDTSNLSEDELMYLSHAVGIGVINGDVEGTFRPNDTLLRSECAKVIYTYTN